MQLEQLDRDVSSGGIVAQNQMSINMDGTAFKILSDGLYQDKIGSIVRETYSNVVDAHTANGEPKKAGWIKLPNAMDLTYVVRDEGIGLDEQGVMEVATTYFGSTKRSENASIGGFGLGFKSPFAYTDQWTIVSVFNGKRRMFSAYMDENGVPNVALLSTDETDAVNGVEIRIPVKPQDVSAFTEAVTKQLRWFDPRPIVTGATIEWPSDDITYELDGVGYISFNENWYDRSASVVSGPVAYPLDLNQVFKDPHDQSARELKRLFDSVKAVLFMDIGEVLPTPSREALQYTPSVVQNITRKLSVLADAAKANLLKEATDKPTYYDACVAMSKVRNHAPHGWSSFVEKAEWNGEELGSAVFLGATSARNVDFDWRAYSASGYDLRAERFALRGSWSTYAYVNVDPNDGFIFVDDFGWRTMRQAARIKRFYEQLDPKERQLALSNGTYIFRELTVDEVFDMLRGFPKERIIPLSSIELPKIQRSASTGRISAPPEVKLLDRTRDRTGSGTDIRQWSGNESASGELDPSIYVVTDRGHVRQKDLVFISDVKTLPGKIYAVPKSLASKFEKNSEWKELETAYTEAVKADEKNLKNLALEHAKFFGSSSVHYEVFSTLRKMKDEDVKPIKGSPKAFWKLYSMYLDIPEPDIQATMLTHPSGGVFEKEYNVQREEVALQAAQLSHQFEKENPTFFTLLDACDYRGIPTEIIPDLVKKLV